MTRMTSDGFWRSFDRDHEPVVQAEPTSQSIGVIARWATCHVCGMPCHLEKHTIDLGLIGIETLPASELAHGRDVQTAWVARHGPAPYGPRTYLAELRGTTPVIELPDATVMVDVSQGKRHLPMQGTQEHKPGSIPRASLLCGTLADKHWLLKLGDCWQADVCKLCLENSSQI